MVDKEFCMSSYLAFRHIVARDIEFAEGLHHQIYVHKRKLEQIRNTEDIDRVLTNTFETIKNKHKQIGLMLSGGMDSGILASYLSGYDAYTFRFPDGQYGEELERARNIAEINKMKLHYVDIGWDIIEPHIDAAMKKKGAPVHSIEPQIIQAAEIAKDEGIELMIIGDASDYVFGGMDQLLSKDWDFDDFIKRYCYIQPSDVLVDSRCMREYFEPYRSGDKIDFLKFMDMDATTESYASYENAFAVAGLSYFDPYEVMEMAVPLDLGRIRNGESKYFIRELFAMKYPDITVPEKIPMPRPVDYYFAKWDGPTRPEFKKNIQIEQFSGNQKWLLYCLERFLNKFVV